MVEEEARPERPRDEPAPAHIFEDPEVRARVEEALARTREGRVEPGLSSDDLLELAREQRRLDARP